ncbi:hypothetical protein JTB14_000531 [Gonioctena quinquepunctata]|nr:hypothetical protein JTB14_000531 [Gonioctena quinquepunctata]
MTIEEAEKHTQNDNTMCLLKKDSIYDKNETWNHPQLTPLREIKQELNFQGNIVLRSTRIILPTYLQRRAVEIAHKGHQGIVKIKQLLRRKVWFQNIDSMTEMYINGCEICQAVMPSNRRDPVNFQNTGIYFSKP